MRDIGILKKSALAVIMFIFCFFFENKGIYAQDPIQKANFSFAIFPSCPIKISTSSAGISVAGKPGMGGQSKEPHVMTNMKLNPVEGLIEIWIQPQRSGSDGEKHRIWKTNKANGRQLIVRLSISSVIRYFVNLTFTGNR